MRFAFLLCASLYISACYEPESDCAHGPARCQDNVAYTCFAGCPDRSCHPHWEMQACDEDETCIIRGGAALCALSTTPDPECQSEWHYEYCSDDGRIITCVGGFQTSAIDCPATGRTCMDGPSLRCVESTVHDPRCPTELFNAAICDGDHKLECSDGFLIRETECEAGCVKPEGFYNAACIHPGSAEICAVSDRSSFCFDEDLVVQCHEGLALEIEHCDLEDSSCQEDAGACETTLTR